MNKKPYWFKRRRYGWGWVPVTWQGWLSVGAYLLFVVAAIPAFLDAPEPDRAREAGFFFLFLALASVSLFLVSIGRGPTPRWRWGSKPGDDAEEDF